MNQYRIFFPSFYSGELLSKYTGRLIKLSSPLHVGEILDLGKDGEFTVKSIVREINGLFVENEPPIVNLVS